MNKIFSLTAALLTSLFISPNAAVALEICGQIATAEMASGDYKMEVGPRELKTAELTRNFPNVLETTASIFEIGGELGLVSEQFPLDITFMPIAQNEPAWQFSASEAFNSSSSEDIGLAADCNFAELPRLLGLGHLTSNQGEKIPVTLKLVIVLADENISLAIGTLEYVLDSIRPDGSSLHIEIKTKIVLSEIE